MTARLGDFLEFLRQMKPRFYQERDLGLDLYFSGYPGIFTGVLAIALVVVFLLAIFHLIPVKRHVTLLLLGIGALAFTSGFTASLWNFHHLDELAPRVIRASAGPAPAGPGQRAAVIALPLVVGALTLLASLAGSVYMALFWGGSAIARARQGRSRHGRRESRRAAARTG